MPAVIVTGAARGLGFAITKILLDKGINVVAISRNVKPLEALKSDSLHVIAGDVTDTSLFPQVAKQTLDKYGSIDGLILNAGVLDPVSKICDANIDEVKTLFDINFFSLFTGIGACANELRKSHGRVIIISSGAAVSAPQTWGPYGASKAAANFLAAQLGHEEPDFVTVALRPGVVDTDMQRAIRDDHAHKMLPEQHAKFVGMHRDKQMVKPEEVGNVIANLSLKAKKDLSGKFVNWTDIRADYDD
ncbi:hypothetical protein PYCC9005_000474 [Savitreella phatthalungensis]